MSKFDVKMSHKPTGMTASKYLRHLANFAHVATFSHKPRLALQALRYYKEAENCAPKEPIVVNVMTFRSENKPKNDIVPKVMKESIFYPSSQRNFDLLKKNYQDALHTKKLSIALQILKRIGEELGLYDKSNYTKQEFTIINTPYQDEE